MIPGCGLGPGGVATRPLPHTGPVGGACQLCATVACPPADHRGHGERVIAPPPPLDVTAAGRHSRRRTALPPRQVEGFSGYRGGSGLRGGSGARGYPGSTTKPGSTTIIRAYKPQKGRKARPATERGTAARGRQHPSPARGGPVAPAPQARRAIPARKWQLTRKSGHVATTIRTPRAYPPPLRGLWGLSY